MFELLPGVTSTSTTTDSIDRCSCYSMISSSCSASSLSASLSPSYILHNNCHQLFSLFFTSNKSSLPESLPLTPPSPSLVYCPSIATKSQTFHKQDCKENTLIICPDCPVIPSNELPQHNIIIINAKNEEEKKIVHPEQPTNRKSCLMNRQRVNNNSSDNPAITLLFPIAASKSSESDTLRQTPTQLYTSAMPSKVFSQKLLAVADAGLSDSTGSRKPFLSPNVITRWRRWWLSWLPLLHWSLLATFLVVTSCLFALFWSYFCRNLVFCSDGSRNIENRASSDLSRLPYLSLLVASASLSSSLFLLWLISHFHLVAFILFSSASVVVHPHNSIDSLTPTITTFPVYLPCLSSPLSAVLSLTMLLLLLLLLPTLSLVASLTFSAFWLTCDRMSIFSRSSNKHHFEENEASDIGSLSNKALQLLTKFIVAKLSKICLLAKCLGRYQLPSSSSLHSNLSEIIHKCCDCKLKCSTSSSSIRKSVPTVPTSAGLSSFSVCAVLLIFLLTPMTIRTSIRVTVAESAAAAVASSSSNLAASASSATNARVGNPNRINVGGNIPTTNNFIGPEPVNLHRQGPPLLPNQIPFVTRSVTANRANSNSSPTTSRTTSSSQFSSRLPPGSPPAPTLSSGPVSARSLSVRQSRPSRPSQLRASPALPGLSTISSKPLTKPSSKPPTTTTTTTTTTSTTTTTTTTPEPTTVLYEDEYDNDYIVESNDDHSHHLPSNVTISGDGHSHNFDSPDVFAFGSNSAGLVRPYRDMYFKEEMQRYDGWYNNLAHPGWGSTESHLTRKAPPSYADGVYMMAGEDRPSPRELSQALMKGEDGKGSARNLTVLFAFFGQMVSSEILMASEPGCPIEMHRIKIAKCDEMYDRDCRGGRTMPFHRAIYDTRTGQSPNNPREQLNMVTSWIDGSFIYSTSETWLNSMRQFENGTFKTDETGGFPPRNRERVPLINSPPAHHLKMTAPDRMFLLGDSRTNQNPVILAFGIVMFRWHNVLARRVQSEHPDWSDEDIFQRSRRLVIASLQNIILYEYLETLFNEPIPPYSGYKPDVHPGVSHVFQSAAFRFGHTMIPPGLYRRDARCNFLKTAGGYAGIRLCSTWWDAVDVLPNAGLEELLMGLSSQIAEREDSVLCSDVRDKLFGPLDFSRRDLAALNIMRGRDNGIPDYNTIRKYFKLPPISNWSQINLKLHERSPELFETLAKLYDNNLENIDVYVGGMVESEMETGRPGPLFRAIIREQFLRIRDSDRFWFENEHNGLFTKEEINEIKKIKLWDVIVNATAVPTDAIQRDVFLFRPNDPCPQPRQMTSKVLESCVILAGWNYFHGSELPYIMVILLLVFIPMLVAVMGYAVIKMNNRRRRKIKQQRDVDNKKNYDKLYVREWLHQNHKRYVKAKIGPDHSISTVNRKGETLRKILISDTSSLLVEVTQDSNKPMILIRPPRDHDLVLQFDNNGARKKYLSKLESFLLNHKKTLEIIHTYRDIMLANAETKEKRQKRLEHFFREAYALTFGLKPGEKRKFEDVSNDVIMVMRTSLSRKEFAEALGMKSDSLFVNQMFNCCDKDNDGRISFQEFLDTVVLFSRGKTDNKLRIIFDMCDHDADGIIDKMDLTKMLRSLVDIAKLNSMTEDEVMELIEGMFASAGLEDKEELTYDDFKHMMSEYRGDLIAIGLDCKGAKQNFLDTSTNIARMTSFQINSYADPEPNFILRRWNHFITYLEENRQPIVYLLIFFVASIVLFLERFITYSYLSEHTDLRHVMGYGIAITRGSAASLSFCYSLLLLTMCRNLITKIREIPLHQYIPLDSHVQFHKIVAITGLIFTIIHTIGHCINFYHVSTQPVEHLRCLTKELQFESDAKPTFSFWIFGTVTGITGILLVLVVAIIFIFAHPRIRQKAYSYFWMTHSLYVVLYLLMFIHGLAKITGTPRFWVFFIGPAIVFILDKIVSLQTKYMELEVLDTELLPSDVTKVKFSRPPNFKYLSGQWIRLCCTAFRSSEYHSLTLTSAPHENYLSVHVKAQGPWTWKLRNYFDPNNFVNIPVDSPLPKIRLEGPFGGGNQDWYKYEVAVMVGGGIGVTPYASILNDLVFGTSTNRYSGVACKKVYFLWICPSHRHFEWFIDVLRDVERKDVTQVLEVHIFITQFFHKFDLRTTMLYICENHFQRLSNKSMFTGLKAVNHFGRPDMNAFLKFVQNQHSYVSKVGVFSCGPSALTKSVSKACETTNNRRKLPYFIHQFENFG